MNDLNGLDWSAKPANSQNLPNYNNAFSSLKPTIPTAGRASPLSSTASPKPPSKPATPANDSFSNLVSFSSNTANKNLSLQEQQRRLTELKLGTTGGTSQNQFAGVDDSIWNNLGSGRSTPQSPQNETKKDDNEEDDFLSAFNAPKSSASVAPNLQPSLKAVEPLAEEDDDPFGLSEFQAKQQAPSQPAIVMDDDDVLGLLGKPVSERPPVREQISAVEEGSNDHPQDKAVAELVDMGFSAQKARQALETTESGTDVQAAVGWLLTQAHYEAQSRSRARNRNTEDAERPSRSRPAQEEPVLAQQERRSGTPSNDPARIASELSSTFLKTAGSLWKQGQKKVQQAVQEFNSDSDSSQPKWMREPKVDSKPLRRLEATGETRQRRRNSAEKHAVNVTDEAMMLEGSRPERPPRQTQRPRREMVFDSSADNSRDHSPAMPSRLRESHTSQPQQSMPRSRPQPPIPTKPNLSRQAAEEQAATAYVSSARRRKPATPSAPVSELEPNLFEQNSKPTVDPRIKTSLPSTRPVKSTPIATRPPAPTRAIPPLSAIALKASHADREKGNEHFKKGDYASAHQSYTRSLSHLPTTHPITIILLTNRALTALKTGEPKSAVADSDAAIRFIGPSKGESEAVDLVNGEPPKPMRDYYGKALMRKAEALEQMEKWAEAAVVWKEAVEGGHGGATSIQSRIRAEKAANPQAAKPKSTPAKRPAPRPAARSNNARPGASTEAAAVTRLRAQNAAAEKADDERFALADSVDARITAWKGGKADNLRALLGSLDTVLWPEAEWKKISMADLVLPNKVKIQYMKGIAKVHPDKIPTDASTEQRMIAGSVFSTLNEAWDKFKKENGL